MENKSVTSSRTVLKTPLSLNVLLHKCITMYTYYTEDIFIIHIISTVYKFEFVLACTYVSIFTVKRRSTSLYNDNNIIMKPLRCFDCNAEQQYDNDNRYYFII